MNKHLGSRFDDFLEEEDVLAEAEAIAVKRVITFQLKALMKEQKLNKTPTGEANENQPFSIGAFARP